MSDRNRILIVLLVVFCVPASGVIAVAGVPIGTVMLHAGFPPMAPYAHALMGPADGDGAIDIDAIAGSPAGAAFAGLLRELRAPADDARRTAYAQEAFAPALIERRPVPELVSILDRLADDFGAATLLGVAVETSDRFEGILDDGGQRFVLGVEIEPAAPHRILGIAVTDTGGGEDLPPVSWETLARDFENAVEEGFHGSVIAVRNGEVVLDQGFGFADPQQQHPVTARTLFAIGSTPIDFTHVALLMLEQEGRLSLDDHLDVFFDGVPADKAAITLDHLRTGRSGMIDFPNLRGVDDNPDLSWIDRDELLRRAWASDLLFEPGTDERHSHFAWGVLAAVIEVVTGTDYESFVRERIFEPASMQRTGNYPLAKRVPMAEVAVGLGGNVWGEVNAPTHWGPTSWLVMGSGGMVSTPRDLRRFFDFVASKGTLSDDNRHRFGVDGVNIAEGGNDRGFVNTIGRSGDALVIVCSNSQVAPGDFTMRFAMAAVELVDER